METRESYKGGVGEDTPFTSNTHSSSTLNPTSVVHSLVLVAKLPKLGACKTRLLPNYCAQFCLDFTEACLKDILTKFSLVEKLPLASRLQADKSGYGKKTEDQNSSQNQGSNRTQQAVLKRFILFKPAEDREQYKLWLEKNVSKEVRDRWTLLPYREQSVSGITTSGTTSLEMSQAISKKSKSDLGTMLNQAIWEISKLNATTAKGTVSIESHAEECNRVCFIGMDTPHLPLSEVLDSLRPTTFPKSISASSTDQPTAMIYPAKDGGYVLLSLPILNGAAEIDYFQVNPSVLFSHMYLQECLLSFSMCFLFRTSLGQQM